jgi:hypothetical protein
VKEAGDGGLDELLERWLTAREGWPPVLVGPPDLAQALGELARPGVVAATLRALACLHPLIVADVGSLLFAGADAGPVCRLHREAVGAADSVLLVLGAREKQVRAGLDQLNTLLALRIAPERLRVVMNDVGGPAAAARIQLERVVLSQLAERRFAPDAWLPWDARALARAQRTGLPLASARRRGGYARAHARRVLPPGCSHSARARAAARPASRGRAGAGKGGRAVTELTLEPADTVRARLEWALASEEVNLASETGRGRTEALIEETLRFYEAALSGQAPALDSQHRMEIAAELRSELIGLGAIAERMLADPLAQEWMINGPKRIFRDTGERIERVPDLVFDDDARCGPSPSACSSRSKASGRPHHPAHRSPTARRVAPDRRDPARVLERLHDLHHPPLPARCRHRR